MVPLVSLCLLFSFGSLGCSESKVDPSTSSVTGNPSPLLWGDFPRERPSCVKGIHLTSWMAGNKKERARFDKLLAETELNTVVIDVKEIEGEVYIPGVKLDNRIDVYVPAVRDIKEYLSTLKDRGVYTIARIVVFKDFRLAKEKPEWAVQSSSPLPKAVENGFDPQVWVDNKGSPWGDPYNPWVWKYNIDIAVQAVELGFQEVQFDYIRFPSDGSTRLCVYSKPHSIDSSTKALAMFLKKAQERLKPMGANISIDVFGLAGSNDDGLGIGQKLSGLLESIDTVSPMMYPSHYAKGEFGIKDPNSSPYETVYRSVKDTLKVIGNKNVELRPYLQDFSLRGVRYTAKEVNDQIQAALDLGVSEWLLWNPGCRYTEEALEPHIRR